MLLQDTRKILDLLERLDEVLISEDINVRMEMEDSLKKICILRFVAEVEYHFINTIMSPMVKEEKKRVFRQMLIKELKYDKLKSFFEVELWSDIERRTIERLREERGYDIFDPTEDADFDSIVKVRNEIAHSSSIGELLDIGSLKKCIDYMELLLGTLSEEIS